MSQPATHDGAPGRFLPRPVLAYVGRRPIRSYPAMLYVGCVAGIYAGAAVASASGLDADAFATAAIALLIPALAGSRLLFVFQHRERYRRDLRRIWRHSDGGAALYGGLFASLALAVPLLRALGVNYWRFWDAAVVTMLVGDVFTRLGCLMTGCCAGRPTDGRFGVMLPDGLGARRRRVPTQLLEAAWAATVVATAVAAMRVVSGPGGLFGICVALYGAGRALLELTREAAAHHHRGAEWNVVTSVLLAGIGAVVVAVTQR